MTLKIKQSALEHSFFIHNLKFDTSLLVEIEAFKKRNGLIIPSNYNLKGIKSVCCEPCLKAHILTKAKELNIDARINDIIEDLFKCEIGHNGYYLDEGKLLKFN